MRVTASLAAIALWACSSTSTRPFLFFVRDGATGLVLFSGQVVAPEPA